jgi:hypothetical protein
VSALHWHGLLALERVPTDDGRTLALGGLLWDSAPCPIIDQAGRIVGSITALHRVMHEDGTARVYGTGRYTGEQWAAGEQVPIAIDMRLVDHEVDVTAMRGWLIAARLGGEPAWPDTAVTLTAERVPA